MFRQGSRSGFVLLVLCSVATSQVLTIPGSTNRFSNAFALDAIQSAQMDFNFFTINSKNENLSPLQTPAMIRKARSSISSGQSPYTQNTWRRTTLWGVRI
jgi:hypothetical protein